MSSLPPRGYGPGVAASDPFSSIWTVVVIAALIFIVALIRGHLSAGLMLALVALLLAGAIWPPLGIVVGGIALFWIVLVHGVDIGRSTGLVPPKGAQQ